MMDMKKSFWVKSTRLMLVMVLLVVTVLASISVNATSQLITNNTVWRDTSGNEIQAQGGAIRKFGSTYYLYGTQFPIINGEVSGQFLYINCYSSTDLAHWTFRNHILTTSSHPQLDPNQYNTSMNRVDVLYNSSTGKYVLCGKYESTLTGGPAGIGFADCSTPDGNFTWRGFSLVWGQNTGDSSLFQESNGDAYYVYTYGTYNAHLHISKLSSDYLSLASFTCAISTNSYREAPGIFKKDGTYYCFNSGTDGWNSTATKYYTASNIAGPWSGPYDLATSPSSGNSFNTQTDYVVPVTGASGTTYMYCGDRYSEFTGQGIGKNAWFPLTWNGSTPTLNGYTSWYIDADAGTWSLSGGGGNNLALSASASTTSIRSGDSASAAKDGNYNTFFKSASNPTFPQYFTYTWSSAQNIGSVILTSDWCQGQAPTNWDIQVSTDGSSNWTTVASSGTVAWAHNDGTIESKSVTASASNVKGVRLKINSANLTWSQYQIDEVEVYGGSGGSTPTPTPTPGSTSTPTPTPATTPTPTPVPGSNIILNAGFESGNANWSDWGSSSSVANNAHSGTYSRQVGTGSGGCGQDITGASVVPGASYTYKVWCKVASGQTGYAGVNCYDSGGNNIGSYQIPSVTNTSYAQSTITFTCPSGTVKMQPWLWKDSTGGNFWADDMELYKN